MRRGRESHCIAAAQFLCLIVRFGWWVEEIPGWLNASKKRPRSIIASPSKKEGRGDQVINFKTVFKRLEYFLGLLRPALCRARNDGKGYVLFKFNRSGANPLRHLLFSLLPFLPSIELKSYLTCS